MALIAVLAAIAAIYLFVREYRKTRPAAGSPVETPPFDNAEDIPAEPSN